ncbi:hypothetical protein BGY98DRAFT_1092464 [Russula aff. rugulosa BPL654]|nr:hypothetical protein BGY98DRAFT_1092464 [Russula aff. rugulosa BPL654]
MRLPSSSSLLLASLAVSSSLSLAAPAGDGPESFSSPPVPPHASIPHGSNNTMAQPNGAPSSCTTTFLSNTTTGYLQATDLVDQVTASLTLPPDLVKGIPDILHAILDPLVGEDAPKAWGVPPDVVKDLVSAGKTTQAEEADDRGEHAASEDPSMQPFASQPEASAPQRLGVKMRLSPSLILLPVFQVVSSDVKGMRQVTEGRKEILLILLSLPLPSPMSGNSTAPALILCSFAFRK